MRERKQSFRDRLQQLKREISSTAPSSSSSSFSASVGSSASLSASSGTDSGPSASSSASVSADEEKIPVTAPAKATIIVCALLRSSITKKVFSIWKTKLPTICPDIVEVTSTFCDVSASSCETALPQSAFGGVSQVYVILPLDTTKEQFCKWSGHDFINVSPSPKSSCCYYYLSPNWVYSFIKTGNKENADELLPENLHALHMSLPLAKSFPQHNIICCTDENLSKKRTLTDIHHHSSRQQQDSQDMDSQDRDEMTVFISNSPKKKGRFACMIDSNPELNPAQDKKEDLPKKKENLNAHITDKFKELHKIYEMEGDHWRARTYKQACTVLEQLPFRVTDSEQLAHIGGKGKGCMGKSVRAKIQEIITSDGLSKLSGLQRQNPDIQIRMEFNKIWGVGPSTAKSLVDQGFTSISHLRSAMSSFLQPLQEAIKESQKNTDILDAPPTLPPRCPLTVQQMIGLNRFEDLLERMDRNEVRDIEKTVLTAVNKLDSGASCVVCGSYRRGKPTSGDVDILIYPNDGREDINLLPDLLNELTKSGFLTDHLTVPHTFEGYYPPLPLSQSSMLSVHTDVVDDNKTVSSMNGKHERSVCSKLNDDDESDPESDHAEHSDEDQHLSGETSKKKLKRTTSSESCVKGGLTRSNSNIVYCNDASQLNASLHSQDRHPEALQSNSIDVVNDRKRQRQIQLQKRSVVFNRGDAGPTASYMGVCRLPKLADSTGTRSERRYRRIDMKTYPRSYLPFAMLYFTGSAHFNRSMRLFCRQKGYTLSDKGLFACTRDHHAVKTYTSEQSVRCHTEHDVFKVLGLEYKEPWNRNTFDNANITVPEGSSTTDTNLINDTTLHEKSLDKGLCKKTMPSDVSSGHEIKTIEMD